MKVLIYFKCSCSHIHIQNASLSHLLCLLNTVHVFVGQAGAVQGLLWIFSVALEHLGLQLSAQSCRLPGARNREAEKKLRHSKVLGCNYVTYI